MKPSEESKRKLNEMFKYKSKRNYYVSHDKYCGQEDMPPELERLMEQADRDDRDAMESLYDCESITILER